MPLNDLLPGVTSWAAWARSAELAPRLQACKQHTPLTDPAYICKVLSSPLEGKLTQLATEHRSCHWKAQKVSALTGPGCKRHELQIDQRTFSWVLKRSRTAAEENRAADAVDHSPPPRVGLARSVQSATASQQLRFGLARRSKGGSSSGLPAQSILPWRYSNCCQTERQAETLY